MIRPRYHIPLLALVCGLLALAPAAGLAQTDAGQCPALVEQALDELGQNCDSLDRNSACYGFNRVDATFTQDVAEDFFSQPADRSQITNLQTIETAPMDTALEYWGIAVLNVQANVPNTLPGQAVTFILLGDVEVENAVPPEQAAQPADPIRVTTLVNANIRSAPGTNANVIGSVPPDTELTADAISPDQGWLRVLYRTGPGWVSRQVLQETTAADTLPALDRETRSPMQAFYFQTRVGDPLCQEAPPSLLVIQGPEDVRVDLTANGADISLGSTIALLLLPGNIMQLITLDGEARIGNLVIPAGFKISVQLSEDGRTVAGPWKDFGPITEEDRALLGGLEGIPVNILHYPIFIPTQAQIQALLDQFAQISQPPPGFRPPVGANAGTLDCSALSLIAPAEALPAGSAQFEWTPVTGATSYQVNLYDGAGNLIASGTSEGTNLTLGTANVGAGPYFWEVLVIVNGQTACRSDGIRLGGSDSPFELPTPTPVPTPEATQFACSPGCFPCNGDCCCGS